MAKAFVAVRMRTVPRYNGPGCRLGPGNLPAAFTGDKEFHQFWRSIPALDQPGNPRLPDDVSQDQVKRDRHKPGHDRKDRPNTSGQALGQVPIRVVEMLGPDGVWIQTAWHLQMVPLGSVSSIDARQEGKELSLALVRDGCRETLKFTFARYSRTQNRYGDVGSG
jgi:hypothetical protein